MRSEHCVSSLHSVSLFLQALKEIRSLSETSKFLEEKKSRLTQIQAHYVKEISALSGAYNLLYTVAFSTFVIPFIKSIIQKELKLVMSLHDLAVC